MMIHENPAGLLQTLIRFDTTNPPGNELACIQYLDGVICSYGIETQMLALDKNRPNLVARIPGSGNAPPLILQGHVDVVPVAGQEWEHPPFSAEIHDGYIWGRGALDMKGGVAMLVCAFLSLKASGQQPSGDIILCLLSDEERGGVYGARYLVEQQAHIFDGAKYSIGEFGGFPMRVGGAKCYPIQVAERVSCGLELTVRGPAGHGALIMRDGAMAELGRVLTRLNKKRLPVHITPATRLMVEGIAEAASGPTQLILRQLLNPRRTDATLKLLGSRLASLEPLFRNTVNATIVRGGDSINVIPGEVSLKLDGRMLPGMSAQQLVSEVQQIVGKSAEIKVIEEVIPVRSEPDLTLFPLLADILRELDSDAHPVPYMLPAVSDGRWFEKLGIQNYGYLPLNLPESFNFSSFIHAANERVPIESLNFGRNALIMLLQRYQ